MTSQEHDDAFAKAAAYLATQVRGGVLDRVLFSSAVVGEGTTTVMLEIATRLIDRFGIKPLAVELCWSHPGFAAIFEVDPQRTLASFAKGECTARECIQQTPSGLSIVPVADEPLPFGFSDIAGLLGRLLEEITGDFDCIFVDGAPLVAQADTFLVSTVVPRIVLVVESGRTRAEVVRRVKRELNLKGIFIVAAILNKQRRWIPGWIYRWLVK